MTIKNSECHKLLYIRCTCRYYHKTLRHLTVGCRERSVMFDRLPLCINLFSHSDYILLHHCPSHNFSNSLFCHIMNSARHAGTSTICRKQHQKANVCMNIPFSFEKGSIYSHQYEGWNDVLPSELKIRRNFSDLALIFFLKYDIIDP